MNIKSLYAVLTFAALLLLFGQSKEPKTPPDSTKIKVDSMIIQAQRISGKQKNTIAKMDSLLKEIEKDPKKFKKRMKK